MSGENKAAQDRRTGHRFPLRLAVRFRTVGAPTGSTWTVGESVNISRAGLLFTTPETVTPGETVEASVAWPVFLDNHVALKLVIKGPIVRNSGNRIAMCFETYEFRTSQTSSESNLTSRGL
jgi:hypothetical protein